MNTKSNKANQIEEIKVETIVLDNAQRDAFLEILENPPSPNDALKSLLKKDQ